ncbi:MAG: cofactor-independent phosphoglycerate mutase [Ruminococcaceae bacterium]|nr:cofactor-independent phosphoglycerate mutase [Oscillospiraceae bacterium]
MKYIVVLGDGMSDYPVKELGNKTPLECAKKPRIDYLCQKGEIGLVSNVPKSLKPGSDVANLSAMGYDPEIYYSGRSPLEAVSMGVDIKETDVVFRCNVVTVSDEENYEDKRVVDHSADEITTEEARELIKAVNEAFKNEYLTFYPGVSYRHAMVWDKGSLNVELTPPHDILEKRLGDYIPKGDGADIIFDMMKKSYEILKNHPVNIARVKKGLNPANSIWIWGEGKKPKLESFKKLYGLDGAVISAVDLIKGIAICAELNSIDVEGATGNIHTNFDGKAKAAVDALKNGADFMYIHLEAPDECGHRHEIENKVKSIELIDEKIVGYIIDEMNKIGEKYKILVLPDHPTPLDLRTHTRDAVPYVLYDSTNEKDSIFSSYTEENAKKAAKYYDKGCKLLSEFLK